MSLLVKRPFTQTIFAVICLLAMSFSCSSGKLPVWYQTQSILTTSDSLSTEVYCPAELDSVYQTGIETASFPGGGTAWHKFINEHQKHPVGMQKTGKIFLSFHVNKTGDIRNIKVIKGINPSYDLRAVELLKKSGKWLPATLNDQKVNSALTISIVYHR